jgi:hypothetical protein
VFRQPHWDGYLEVEHDRLERDEARLLADSGTKTSVRP